MINYGENIVKHKDPTEAEAKRHLENDGAISF
jgi:hypothetical protein